MSLYGEAPTQDFMMHHEIAGMVCNASARPFPLPFSSLLNDLALHRHLIVHSHEYQKATSLEPVLFVDSLNIGVEQEISQRRYEIPSCPTEPTGIRNIPHPLHHRPWRCSQPRDQSKNQVRRFSMITVGDFSVVTMNYRGDEQVDPFS